jgi:hypothetical protein
METKYNTKYLNKEQKQALRRRELRPHDYISNYSIERFLDGRTKFLRFGNWR